MVFSANRDIHAGEECCISYFDMTQYVKLKERREHLQSLFRFRCGCTRCMEEDVDMAAAGSEEGEMQWNGLMGFE
jgi:trans-aconitate 2-methyltransferase